MRFYALMSVLCTSITLFGGEFKIKDYHYLIDKMPEINKELLETHFKLYQGYVDQVNALNRALTQELSKATGSQSFTYQSIKRHYGWEYDGMVLHELYFENLGGDGKIALKSLIYNKIKGSFGSVDAWRGDFEQNCLVRGIGWVILYWDPKTDQLKNVWVGEHSTGPLIGQVPLLVIDLWEHAYLCQFGLDRRKYVQTIMKYIDWGVVESRINR